MFNQTKVYQALYWEPKMPRKYTQKRYRCNKCSKEYNRMPSSDMNCKCGGFLVRASAFDRRLETQRKLVQEQLNGRY